jgi:hypothetical protein
VKNPNHLDDTIIMEDLAVALPSNQSYDSMPMKVNQGIQDETTLKNAALKGMKFLKKITVSNDRDLYIDLFSNVYQNRENQIEGARRCSKVLRF